MQDSNMENLEHRGSVDPTPEAVDIDVLNQQIDEQARALFGDTPTIDTNESRNPLLRFFGENLGSRLLPVPLAVSLVASACGDGNSGVDVDLVTQEPGQTVVIGNTQEPTNTSESDTPTPDSTNEGKGDGATSTQRPVETSTPTAEPTEEPLPIYEREDYPYELAEVKEYQGSEVKFVFGIEKAAYDRPEDNVCSKIANFSNEIAPCPPIRRFELSDEYLREFSSDKYPDGMREVEMVQRYNDFILKGFVWNLQQKGSYADLTVDKLKDMIHEGKAPEFVQTFANGDSINWDLNDLEIHLILTDKSAYGESGVKTVSTGSTVKFQQVDSVGVLGLWAWQSFLLDFENTYKNDPWHRQTHTIDFSMLEAISMMSYDKFPEGKIDHTFIEDNIMPVADYDKQNVNGIIVVSK